MATDLTPSDSKIAKWLQWIEEPIRNDILTMHLHRSTFRDVGAMAEQADLPVSYFWEFLRDTYTTTQAVAVRRQAEPSSRVRSLARLIDEARMDCHRLTREWWIGLWDVEDDGYELQIAARAFDSTFAGSTGKHLDPEIAQADLARLIAGAAGVKRFVDGHVAHTDRRPTAAMPSFDDLDAAIDDIGELFSKYANLLTASSYARLTPAVQHDWKAPFRVPWITPRRGR